MLGAHFCGFRSPDFAGRLSDSCANSANAMAISDLSAPFSPNRKGSVRGVWHANESQRSFVWEVKLSFLLFVSSATRP